MGIKSDDWNAVSLCHHHHQMRHNMGVESFWSSIGKDPHLEITKLQAQYERAR